MMNLDKLLTFIVEIKRRKKRLNLDGVTLK